jgi:predicted 2-oxoglutarate/Fe(II)-dependent dioxygenase YbiX
MTQQTGGVANSVFNRPGPHLVMRNFLGADEVARLLSYASEHERAFKPSGVVDADKGVRVEPSIRVSHRLSPIKELKPMVRDRLDAVFKDVVRALGCGAFERTGLEVEMVAHGDGAFFTQHVDTVTGDSDGRNPNRASRVVSMVYYFCRTPARFSGGKLRLHSMAASGAPGTYVDIAPENDTAVFFPSWFSHEVLPVVCDSGEFMDSRFAINCWVYK